MKTFIEIRGKVIEIAVRLWPFLVYIIKFIAALLLFRNINTLFGGSIEILGHSYVPLGLAGVSIFLNYATIGVLALIYMVANMLGISWVLALVTLVLGTFFIGAALYFNRRTAGLVWVLPLLSQMGIPYAAPMACGMFFPVTSCGCVAVGTTVTYFLRAVIGYLPSMADEESTVTALDIFMDQVVTNSSFYILLFAMVLMTVVVYLVGLIRVKGAKLYAVVMGLVVEVLVQYAGKLFFNTGADMSIVMQKSWLVLLIGVLLAFFTSDGNYNRIEKVVFEDDDYIYHVRAIPKTKIAKAHKKVKNVTRDTSKMDLTANLGAVVEVGQETARDKRTPDEKRKAAKKRREAEKKRAAAKKSGSSGKKTVSQKTAAALAGLVAGGKSRSGKKPSSSRSSGSKPSSSGKRPPSSGEEPIFSGDDPLSSGGNPLDLEASSSRENLIKGFEDALVIEKKEGQRDSQDLNITNL